MPVCRKFAFKIGYEAKKEEIYLLDDREHPGLGIVIPVSTDAKVDLLGVGVFLVSSSQLEDAVKSESEHGSINQ